MSVAIKKRYILFIMQSYNNLANGNMISPNSLIKLITQLSYLK